MDNPPDNNFPGPPQRKRNRTPEEIAEIESAFNRSVGNPGIFELMVQGQYEKDSGMTVDTSALKEEYHKLNCPGVVRLIEYCESNDGKNAETFGTSTLDFSNDTDEAYFRGVLTDMVEHKRFPLGITIGNRPKGITPIRWLAYLAKGLSSVAKIQKEAFDGVCDELVSMQEAMNDPDSEIIDDI